MKKTLFVFTLALLTLSFIHPVAAQSNLDYREYLLKKSYSHLDKYVAMHNSALPEAKKIALDSMLRNFYIRNNLDRLEKELEEIGFTKNYQIDYYLNHSYATYLRSLENLIDSYFAHNQSKYSLIFSKLPNAREIGSIANHKYLFFYEHREEIITWLIANNIPAKQYKISYILNAKYFHERQNN